MNASQKNSGKKYGIIAGIAVILVALIVGISIYNSPSNRLSRQLELGERYLEELNYEQALVEYDKAIEIDPMSVDAYLGKAEAYKGMGDSDAALQTLQEGYEKTGDNRLYEALTRIREEFLNEKIQVYGSFYDKLNSVGVSQSGRPVFLTSKEIEEIYRPLTEELEDYVEILLEYQDIDYIYDLVTEQDLEDVDGHPTLWRAYEALFCVYLRLNELDKAVYYREKAMEIKGSALLYDGYTYDQYGRIIEYQGEGAIITFEYNENNQVICYICRYDDGEAEWKTEFEYSSDGRLIKQTECYSSSDYTYLDTYLDTFEYPNAGKVIKTRTCWNEGETTAGAEIEEITINQYGSVVEGFSLFNIY